MRIGAMEAGGTKFVCGIGNEDGIVEDRISFPTGQPEGTLSRAISYFQDHAVEAIGIGSFGPIDLKLDSPTYGYVTSTPKHGWSQINVLGNMKSHMDIPYGWDTDVNAAALGEATGSSQGAEQLRVLHGGYRSWDRPLFRRPAGSWIGSSGRRACSR